MKLRFQGFKLIGIVLGCLLGAVVVLMTSCTQGAVTDANDESLVGGASLKFYSWPPPQSSGLSWAWPHDFRVDSPDFATNSRDISFRGANYGIGAGAGACVNGVDDFLPTHRWYRVVVEKEGYHSRTFYRYHDGYEDECRYYNCSTGEFANGSCNVQNFALWPTSAPRPLLPDIIVDSRDLENHYWQCAILPDDHTHSRLIGLRVGVGAANVGEGPLHLDGSSFDGSTPESAVTYQRIDWSDGREDRRRMPPRAFEWHADHDHIHFRDWVRLELIRSQGRCKDPANRPADCTTGYGQKLSFCVMDLEPFDHDIRNRTPGDRHYPDPPTCDSLMQGLSPGWKDVYGPHLSGQVVIVGTPQHVAGEDRQFWLEVEVDPNRRIQEADRSNNITRVLIDLPDPSAVCNASASTLDCSMPRSEYTSDTQRFQCGNYLRHE